MKKVKKINDKNKEKLKRKIEPTGNCEIEEIRGKPQHKPGRPVNHTT